MTYHIDPRPSWVRERTYELQVTGMRYADAREQAEAEADEKFGADQQLPPPEPGSRTNAPSWQSPDMTQPDLKRHSVTLATGDIVYYDSPMVVVVEGGALKIYEAGRRETVIWYSPSAWTSMDVQPLNG
jgi:hypothetical protein